MVNSLLFLGWTLAGLAAVLLGYRSFGKVGLYGIICGCVVIMNVLVVKNMRIFGLAATGANVEYAMVFLATDILSEFYGGKEARRAVMVGFFVAVVAAAGSWVTLLFVPAEWDFAHGPMSVILSPMPRIVAASWLAYLVSQNLDTYSYQWLKRIAPRQIWLRNNGSTWTSQLVDTLVFAFAGLWGTMPAFAFRQVILTTYLLKVFVALLDTGFLYLAASPLCKEARVRDGVETPRTAGPAS